jgi:hypothetical protein
MVRRVGIALAVGVGALTLCQAAVPASELKGPGVVRITDVQVQYSRIDLGAKGPSPGDVEVTRYKLYNKRVRVKPIGRGQLVCVNVAQNFRQCDGTYLLPAGKMTVSGALQYRGLYDLAVTGGTGFYTNVHGTLTATRLTKRPPTELLLFRLITA